MADDPHRDPDAARAPVDRLITRQLREADLPGASLSRRSLQRQRSLESYLKAGARPRWMERIVEIDRGMARERRRLEHARRALSREAGADRAAFAERWRALATSWRFDELNALIRQHNAWYPIERDLPMDPRTRDYVLVDGRSYRRVELGADWILEQFPAAPADPAP